MPIRVRLMFVLSDYAHKVCTSLVIVKEFFLTITSGVK